MNARAPRPPRQLTYDDVARRVRRFVSETESTLGLDAFDVALVQGCLVVYSLEVPREQRCRGVGTDAMRRLTALADKLGLRIALTPSDRNDITGTTSRARLVRFYSRFGFVESSWLMHKMLRVPATPELCYVFPCSVQGMDACQHRS